MIKRLLAILSFLLGFSVLASATEITIPSFTIPNYAGSSTAAIKVRVYYSATYTASNGTVVSSGSPSGGSIYKVVACTLLSGTITVPTFTIQSTLNGIDITSSKATFYLYNGNAQISPNPLAPYANLIIPATIASATGCSPSGTCASLAELKVWNSPAPPLDPTSYYNKQQVDALILATGNVTSLTAGSSGTDFNIGGVSPSYTINLPDAGASSRGAVTTGTQTLAGAKTFSAAATFSSTINKVTITTPATGATLTIPNGVTLNAGAGGTLGSNAFTSTAFAPLASPTFTGTVTIPTPFTLGAVSVLPTGTELNFVDGVTSSIQTQINTLTTAGAGYAPLASPTFTGTVTIPTPFTLGAVSVLPTGTELNFVDGVTSAIQTQLDAKLPKAGGTMTGALLFTDNTFDIGAAGATRPRTGYFGTSVVTPVLSTSAASPLLLTNSQLVTVALTAQTVGATTLTIPDFASVVDEFTFKTLAQTMSNKTFVAPVLGAATGTSVKMSSPQITAGGGTGVTVNNTGELRRQIYKVTTLYTAYAAAATTFDVTIATLPAKTRLMGIVADTTQAFNGGAVTACTIVVGKTVGGNEYILSHSVFAAAVVKGNLDADLGASITRAAAVQGGDLPSWTATTAITVRLTTTTANTNALTQGSTTFYLVTEVYP